MERVGGADVDTDDGNTRAEREGTTWDCLGGSQPMGACSPHGSRQATGEVSEMRDLAALRRMEERRMMLDLARCHHGRAGQGLCEGVRGESCVGACTCALRDSRCDSVVSVLAGPVPNPVGSGLINYISSTAIFLASKGGPEPRLAFVWLRLWMS
jgi:hypothetical protein